jgi:hypothetical protein
LKSGKYLIIIVFLIAIKRNCGNIFKKEVLMEKPDYTWPTVEDYEKQIGQQVNLAFKMGWEMARTTNDFLKQLAENSGLEIEDDES